MTVSHPKMPLRALLNELYFGHTKRALTFQAWWLAFDGLLIAFFMVAPFMERDTIFHGIDFAIAGILALDLSARAWSFGPFWLWIRRPIVWADLIVLLSLLLAPIFGSNVGFLRVLRLYSMINGAAFWRLIAQGKWANSPVSETSKAAANLFIFVFMMTSIVHTAFAARVPELQSFMDSLYFTVSTLTTTGYGDIVLPGFWGKALSVLMMIGGVSLFVRLIQVLLRPQKTFHPCTSCGLQRHDPDAVHCKACGCVLNIAHDND